TIGSRPVRSLLTILIQPLLEFFLELALRDAGDMAGALDFDHRPIAAHALERYDVQRSHWIAIADQDFDRDVDRPPLLFRQGQVGHAAGAQTAQVRPHSLENAALAQPSHAAERPRDNAIGMLGYKFQSDRTAHRVADNVRLFNFQVIE